MSGNRGVEYGSDVQGGQGYASNEGYSTGQTGQGYSTGQTAQSGQNHEFSGYSTGQTGQDYESAEGYSATGQNNVGHHSHHGHHHGSQNTATSNTTGVYSSGTTSTGYGDGTFSETSDLAPGTTKRVYNEVLGDGTSNFDNYGTGSNILSGQTSSLQSGGMQSGGFSAQRGETVGSESYRQGGDINYSNTESTGVRGADSTNVSGAQRSSGAHGDQYGEDNMTGARDHGTIGHQHHHEDSRSGSNTYGRDTTSGTGHTGNNSANSEYNRDEQTGSKSQDYKNKAANKAEKKSDQYSDQAESKGHESGDKTKVGMAQKISGKMDQMIGKMTHNEAKVEQGLAKEQGTK